MRKLVQPHVSLSSLYTVYTLKISSFQSPIGRKKASEPFGFSQKGEIIVFLQNMLLF